MKKIQLDLDQLAVESFETLGDARGEGTVLALEVTNPRLSDCLNTCDGCPTYSCNGPGNCA